MQFLPFRLYFVNQLATGYESQLNRPVHWVKARFARVYLSNCHLISLREHKLTKTDNRSAPAFYFKNRLKIMSSLFHLNLDLSYKERRGGLMTSVPDPGLNGPGSSPGRRQSVSLHTGV